MFSKMIFTFSCIERVYFNLQLSGLLLHFLGLFENFKLNFNSGLSRCCTARGSGTGFSLVGPAKVKAHKFFSIH